MSNEPSHGYYVEKDEIICEVEGAKAYVFVFILKLCIIRLEMRNLFIQLSDSKCDIVVFMMEA